VVINLAHVVLELESLKGHVIQMDVVDVVDAVDVVDVVDVVHDAHVDQMIQ